MTFKIVLCYTVITQTALIRLLATVRQQNLINTLINYTICQIYGIYKVF